MGTPGARGENGGSTPGGSLSLASSRATFAHVAPSGAGRELEPGDRGRTHKGGHAGTWPIMAGAA
ncbi:MAG: hypothetical protein ACREID_01700, partial [Planctomycetota bacterium]